MREEQETRLAPPCAREGCAQLPTDHMGWALGHLYVEPEGYTGTVPADVAHGTPLKDWEAEGVRILEEAYARWADQPPLRLKIGRMEAYTNIVALQTMCAHPDMTPYMLEVWETMGRQLAELVADTPEIEALIEAGWHREYDVLPDRQEQETEEQPPAAGATVRPDMVNIVTRDSGGIPPQPRPEVDTIDVTRPYCYRIDRTDDPDENSMLSWGSHKSTPHWAVKSALDVATYQAAETRIGHDYSGPLRVSVWQQRDNEHFRQDAPPDAFVLELEERGDDLATARQLIADMDQDA